MLKLEGIEKRYRGVEVLRGISFDVRKSETKVIIGPSGTGKSTLLRCINQLTVPDRGRVWLNGQELTDPKIDINQARSSIGMVFQDFNLFAHLSALDNVRIGLLKVKKLERKEATEIALAELHKVGLASKANSFPAELSGGQQQRVSIARALAMRPQLILFDEPTSALDPELIGEVLRVMIKLAHEGMTMVVVSHEMGFARTVASEIIFMEHGLIVERGPPRRIFQKPARKRTRDFLHKISELYGE